jgi:hypothetical protein
VKPGLSPICKLALASASAPGAGCVKGEKHAAQSFDHSQTGPAGIRAEYKQAGCNADKPESDGEAGSSAAFSSITEGAFQP